MKIKVLFPKPVQRDDSVPGYGTGGGVDLRTMWITQKNEVIPVSKLNDGHLTNILEMLAKWFKSDNFKAAGQKRLLEYYSAASRCTAEYASMALDSELLVMEGWTHEEWFFHLITQASALEEEAAARGIPLPAGWPSRDY